jgi:hypothetical protein
MSRAALRTRRTAGLLGAGLVAGAVLTGCGGHETRTAPAAATEPATASIAPAADTGGDLAAGLLPAKDFGDGAQLTPLPTDRLAEAGMLTGMLPSLHLPPACAAAVQQVVPQVAGVGDAAAQLARTEDTATVELLARPGAGVDAVGSLTGLVRACPSTTVDVPEHGTVTVTLEPLDDAALPPGGAGVEVTVAASGSDRGPWSGTGLAALVPDGDRVLALAQVSPQGGSPDTAAFTDLLRRAYDTQHALG